MKDTPSPAAPLPAALCFFISSTVPLPQVKRWINQRGGLTPHMLFLKGRQLQAMYKPCYLDAQASANKPSPR